MLTVEQYTHLLKSIPASRVSERKGMSYVEAWEIKRHLTRIFGFGGWSADLLSNDLVFDDTSPQRNDANKVNHDVSYKAVMRLTIHGIGPNDQDATYTEAAIGSSHQPDRGEAHDMACKTAESDALKRCAINLGTQFGLSLYDNGSLVDVVQRTLRPPEGYEAVVQSEQPPPADTASVDSPGAEEWAAKIVACTSGSEGMRVRGDMAKAKVLNDTYRGVTLAKHFDNWMKTMGGQ